MIDDSKKQKLRKLLGIIATDEEKQELQRLDAQKVKEIVKFFEEQESQTEDKLEKLMIAFNKYAAITQRHSQNLGEMFGELTESLGKKLGELGGTITTSYEKNKPVNAPGVYKDMINQLSAVNQSIKDKPVPVWNWPQYAGVSVRNKNFSNITPASDALGIGDYDYVAVTYPSGSQEVYKYYQNGVSGQLTATVTVNYTDSTKVSVLNVAKV